MASKSEVGDKIRRIIASKDLYASLYGEDGFRLAFGSTAVLVEVHEIGEGDNRRFAVEVWAPILLDVPITDELCRHVALEAKYLWGALRIYQDSDDQSTGMLAMYYVLLGDYLDPEELVMAIHMTAATADGEDDQLQKRFGGRVVDPEGNYED